MKSSALGLLLLAAVAAAPAADDWRLLARVQGNVLWSGDGQVSWQPVFAQRLIRVEDAARTMADSKARILCSDNSAAILAPDTIAVLDSQENGKIRLYVASGGVRAKVGRFELATACGVLASEGSDCATVYHDDQVISAVFAGQASLECGGQRTPLKAGQMARMNASGQVDVNPPGLTRDALPPSLLPEN